MDVKGAKALSERLTRAARNDDACGSESRQRGDEPLTAASDTNGRACRAVLTHLRPAADPGGSGSEQSRPLRGLQEPDTAYDQFAAPTRLV
jgi:hypothetical protein